jgi:hypothetical protein
MARNRTPDDGRNVNGLFAEIDAYLAVVDAMRREGIEPCWVGEPHAPSRGRHVCAGPGRRFHWEGWG